MRLTEIGADKETPVFGDLEQAIRDYEARNESRTKVWLRHFANDVVGQERASTTACCLSSPPSLTQST
jgi:hypothetical protein